MASNDNVNKALLPAGLRDLLPPEADRAADVVESLRQSFAAHGYRTVKPPLIEFEESMLSGAGAALAADTFRLMDPVSQRMMGLRSDLTVQIARIATTRLAGDPRPLRLTYAGDVLRVKGTQMRPERQFGQVGAELIGAAGGEADTEAILVAIKGLNSLGIDGLTVDLSVPRLFAKLCDALGLEARAAARLRTAFDRKDAAAVTEAAARAGAPEKTMVALLRAADDAAPALEALENIELPESARDEVVRLSDVAAQIADAQPALHLTIDPIEDRGFGYHTGISFTIFKSGVRGELGGGGRYEAEAPDGSGLREPATGFTLYVDTLIRALPEQETPATIFLPWGTGRPDGDAMRTEGWRTVAAIEPHDADEAGARREAARLRCEYLYWDGKAVPLKSGQ